MIIHVQHRYSDATYRIEVDYPQLLSDTSHIIHVPPKSLPSQQEERDLQLKDQGLSFHTILLKSIKDFFTRNIFGRSHITLRLPSVNHKLHNEYTLEDIRGIDTELANEIEQFSKEFGYSHNMKLLHDKTDMKSSYPNIMFKKNHYCE